MTEMKYPRSMADVKRLTTGAAEALAQLRSDFSRATEVLPAQGAEVVRRSGANVSGARCANRIESACSAAEQALDQAADAMITVYAEMRKAGVPEGAEW